MEDRVEETSGDGAVATRCAMYSAGSEAMTETGCDGDGDDGDGV